MKSLLKVLIIFLALQSCNQTDKKIAELKKMLRQSDEIVIVLDNHFNNTNTTLRLKDTAHINIFTELVTGKQEEIDDRCDPIGDIMYKKDGKVLFIAEFSIPVPQLKSNCFYVRYNLQRDTFRHKFTYRAGQALTGLKYEEPVPALEMTEEILLEQ